jgi:hypothetical protein
MHKSSKSLVAWLLRTSESAPAPIRSFEYNKVSGAARHRTEQESAVFTAPELTTGTNVYRAATEAFPPRLDAKREGYVERTVVTSDLKRQWGNRIRIITYDHRGHGASTGADMHTYRIDRLAADLADVLTILRVNGPLTLAGTRWAA